MLVEEVHAAAVISRTLSRLRMGTVPLRRATASSGRPVRNVQSAPNFSAVSALLIEWPKLKRPPATGLFIAFEGVEGAG